MDRPTHLLLGTALCALFTTGCNVRPRAQLDELCKIYEEGRRLHPDDLAAWGAYAQDQLSKPWRVYHQEIKQAAAAVAVADPWEAYGLLEVGLAQKTLGIDGWECKALKELYAKRSWALLESLPSRKRIGAAAELRARGDSAGAIRLLQQVVEVDPRDTEALFQLGLTLVSAERSAEAEQSFERALGTDPTHSGALVEIAALRIVRGDIEAAVRALGRIPRGEEAARTLRNDPRFQVENEAVREALARLESAPAPERMASGEKSFIKAVLTERRSEIQGCYERELVERPHLSGRIELGWAIEPDGSVDGCQVSASTMGSPAVESCLVSVIQSSTFPRPSDGKRVLVRYPFVFKTAR